MLLRACRLLPILIVIAVYVHASESAPKDWKAGSAKDSPVKDWKPRNFDSIEAGKGGYQPWCIYIYDADLKHNTNAYHYEGPKDGVLSNKDAMEKLAGFTKIKIKADGTDSKGFQEAWRKAADKGASLILMSADMTKEAAERTPQAVAAAAASIKTYEETKKAAAVKAEKEKEAKDAQLAAVNTPKEQDAGFKIDTKKPDPKTDPKAKKPADPKTPDPAKKKAPEDE